MAAIIVDRPAGVEWPIPPPDPEPRAFHDVLSAPETRRHLDRTVRVWLGIADADVDVPQLPDRLARIMLRLEEFEAAERDRWGCWDFSCSENYRDGHLWEPEVDRWLAEQRAALSETTVVEPLWPKGAPFAVCLTHDVDLVSPRSTPRQMLRFARAGLSAGVRGRWEPLVRLARPPVRVLRTLRAGIAGTPSTATTLERSVAAEAARGVSASYFFTAPPARGGSRYDCAYAPTDRCAFRGERTRIGDVMKILAQEGFDVGLHGGYAAALAPDALVAERAVLEQATGLKLTTSRQHFLRWDIRTTPRLQQRAGVEVESSLGFNHNVGFRAATGLPFRLFDPERLEPLELIEVPLVVEDTALVAPGGLGLDDSEARRVISTVVDAAAEAGTAITFLFHPDRFPRPDALALFEWVIDSALERDAWVTSVRGLGDWWREREARVLADP